MPPDASKTDQNVSEYATMIGLTDEVKGLTQRVDGHLQELVNVKRDERLRSKWVQTWNWEEFFTTAGIVAVVAIIGVVFALVVRWNLDVPNDRFFYDDAGRRCMTTAESTDEEEYLWPNSPYDTVTLCEVAGGDA